MTIQPTGPHAARAGRTRFLMLGLMFITIIINQMDRTNRSVAATAIAGE